MDSSKLYDSKHVTVALHEPNEDVSYRKGCVRFAKDNKRAHLVVEKCDWTARILSESGVTVIGVSFRVVNHMVQSRIYGQIVVAKSHKSVAPAWDSCCFKQSILSQSLENYQNKLRDCSICSICFGLHPYPVSTSPCT